MHSFPANPDPNSGFKIFADPDPGFEIFKDPDPGLDFFPKISVFYVKKVEKEFCICIKMRSRIQSPQSCGSRSRDSKNAEPEAETPKMRIQCGSRSKTLI